MSTVRRCILVRAADGSCRKIGTIKQVYRPTEQDFYFFPGKAVRPSDGRKAAVDHFSFHYSGQIHATLAGKSRDLITPKALAVPQADHGHSIFVLIECAPEILPVYSKISESDLTLDAKHAKFLWVEISFSNTGFLLDNHLGMGTLLSGRFPLESYLDRHVVVASAVPNNHLLMCIAYGAADNLQHPGSLVVRTFSHQMKRTDSLQPPNL